jgi:hypothetical protein
MDDFEESEWACGRPYLSVGRWQYDGGYRNHVYRHPLGLVEIYEQVGNNPILTMRFQREGRAYGRTWRRVFGQKTIARLAREFIEG